MLVKGGKSFLSWGASLQKSLKAFFIASSLLSSPVIADASSSASFSITRSTIDSGGFSSSATFEIQHSQGHATAIGPSISSNFSLYAGFIAIPDIDGDTILDNVDNCLSDANVLQTNTDGDSEGDACDTDDDNDGLSDVDESTLGTDSLLVDSDGDTLSDYDEVNADGNPGDYQLGVDTDPNDPDTDGMAWMMVLIQIHWSLPSRPMATWPRTAHLMAW